jgi:hypothetical protein
MAADPVGRDAIFEHCHHASSQGPIASCFGRPPA